MTYTEKVFNAASAYQKPLYLLMCIYILIPFLQHFLQCVCLPIRNCKTFISLILILYKEWVHFTLFNLFFSTMATLYFSMVSVLSNGVQFFHYLFLHANYQLCSKFLIYWGNPLKLVEYLLCIFSPGCIKCKVIVLFIFYLTQQNCI